MRQTGYFVVWKNFYVIRCAIVYRISQEVYMKFKLFALFTVLVLAVFCGCGRESRPKFIMVTNAAFPPYEYITGNKIDGIDPAIVGKVADALGYDLTIQDMSFDSLIAAVQSGKAHIAAAGITVTQERKKQVLFTDPYVISRQMIIVKKDSPIKTAEDLKGKRIGVQHGTTGDFYVAKNIGEPERFSNGPLVVAALVADKLDAAVVDSEPAEVFVRQHTSLHILPEPLTFEEYAFAIGKHNADLLKKINFVLAQLKSNGELTEIIRHYRQLHETSAVDNAVVAGEKFLDNVKQSFYLNFIKDQRYMYLVRGFRITLLVTACAVLLGVLIGFAVAVVRCAAEQTGRLKCMDWLCRIYLTVIRGTPVVVQLLIIYFVIFGSVHVDKTLVAIVAFGINSGAYVAEIIRGGIMSIDRGQLEAGRSLGLSYRQTMRFVILPQAFKNVLPALGNEFIVLLKETSVAGYIALQDLTKAGDIIRSQTYDAFLPLIAVALIYLIVVMFLSWLLGRLEKRLKKNE